MEKSFYLHTVGCKVNQYNSQLIRENLSRSGLEEKKDGSFQIVNGCVVTQKAEGKTEKLIRQSLKSAKKVILTGCYTRKKLSFNGIVCLPEEKAVVAYITGKARSLTTISSFHTRTRAFVKIQQGCANSCSYCIIPAVRGGVYSRRSKEVLREVEKLTPFYPELVITGTHLGSYRDVNGENLTLLLKKILKEAQFSRIRLSSIEINEITPELLTLFQNPGLCPHLHIPLQSGSDRILKLMKRQYTEKFFLEKIESIRQEFPDIAFTTDVIVGFPTEEKKDFEHTLNMVEKIGFLKVHIFPYSAREETEAATLRPQVAESIKKEREKILSDLAELSSFNFRKKFIGAEKQVILESKKKDGRLWGYSEDYIPVTLKNNEKAGSGMLTSVTITRVERNFTEAIPL
jgi:threonylcarbamoyladenosine tRNA methylthiotransferase MtaB